MRFSRMVLSFLYLTSLALSASPIACGSNATSRQTPLTLAGTSATLEIAATLYQAPPGYIPYRTLVITLRARDSCQRLSADVTVNGLTAVNGQPDADANTSATCFPALYHLVVKDQPELAASETEIRVADSSATAILRVHDLFTGPSAKLDDANGALPIGGTAHLTMSAEADVPEKILYFDSTGNQQFLLRRSLGDFTADGSRVTFAVPAIAPVTGNLILDPTPDARGRLAWKIHPFDCVGAAQCTIDRRLDPNPQALAADPEEDDPIDTEISLVGISATH